MSENGSPLYASVPGDSNVSREAVYQAICKLVPKYYHEDGWLNVNQKYNRSRKNDVFVLEFKRTQISDEIQQMKYLRVDGVHLKLLHLSEIEKEADSSGNSKSLDFGLAQNHAPSTSEMELQSSTQDNQSNQQTLVQKDAQKQATAQPEDAQQPVQCPICFDDIDQLDSRKLPCGHVMHGECYTNFVKNKFFKCPQCQKVIATPNGNQPDGTMSVRQQSFKLSGHEKDSTGTYEITYNFPDGIQTDRHPKPGARYSGTTRVAYLPMSKEGERVLRLLDRAFKARLTFTVGTSNTTGVSDTVVWNNIHHKTSNYGGPYGYPDAGYLKRVTEELAAVGITENFGCV